MGEEDGCAGLGVGLDDVAIDLCLGHIRCQNGDDVGAPDGVRGFGGRNAVCGGVPPALAAVTHAGDDVLSRVLQVLCMGPPLGAVADDGDALAGDGPRSNVVIGVDGDGHIRRPRAL